MPVSAVPFSVSPATVPLNVKVSGIGFVIDTFQDRSLPLTVPSAISVVLPSASCVPVSVPPEVESVSFERRSPIGVFMVRFHVPSAAMARPFEKQLQLSYPESADK